MRPRELLLTLIIIAVLLVSGFGCQTPLATQSPTSAPATSTVPLSPAPSTPIVSPPNPVTPPALPPSTPSSSNLTPTPSAPLTPARFVLGDLTITPPVIMTGDQVTYSIQVSNTGGTEGSYTVVFKYKSSGGAIGSNNVEVTLKPGETKTATFTTTPKESGTVFVNVNDKGSQYTVTSLPTPVRGVPATSASAITSPPPSMVGINTHTEVYGTGGDPGMITLGPKVGGQPGVTPYSGKHSMAWELKIHGTPVLAPLDMILVGFQNDNFYQIQNGQKILNSGLSLFFESASPDWPGMIIYVYHLYSSPLLLGHYQNPDCGECEGPPVNIQAQGRILPGNRDYVTDKGNAGSCQALMGYTVKRGELIGFAGTVPLGAGTHSFVDIGFKVSDTSENPLLGLKGTDTSGERVVQTGNPYLHWVQPGSFFYWKSYSPDAIFPAGVLAYPFECDGYQLPAEQRNVNFKYTVKK